MNDAKQFPVLNNNVCTTQLIFSSEMGNAICGKTFVIKNTHLNTAKSIAAAVDCAIALNWKMSESIIKRLTGCKALNGLITITQTPSPIRELTPKKHSSATKKREFDAMIAEKYFNKYKNALNRGIEFDLSIAQFAKIVKTKTCYYTGVDLVIQKVESGEKIPDNLLTIERVDDAKGYVKGNVVACSYAANIWKANVVESPSAGTPKLSIQQMIALLTKLDNHLND